MSAGLETLLGELCELCAEAGAPTLSEMVAKEAPNEQGAAVAMMVAAALKSGIAARRAASELEPEQVKQRLERLSEPVGDTSAAAEHLEHELERIRQKLKTDIAQLHTDLGSELPLCVRNASVDDLKRHFSAFVERCFQRWLEAELAEIERELVALTDHTEALVRQSDSELSRASVLPELGTRALEVDSFPRDFGVFALSTVGIAVLFSNALVGGALLLLAPVVARYGRERNEAELRTRAVAEARRAVHDATERLLPDLLRRLDAFRDRLEVFLLSASTPARQGLIEMLDTGLNQREVPGGEAERCDHWQRQLSGLVAKLEAVELRS